MLTVDGEKRTLPRASLVAARSRRARNPDPSQRQSRTSALALIIGGLREVAHGPFEVRGHARLGGGDVAGLEHVEQFVMLLADR